jgi:hypothetical protein
MPISLMPGSARAEHKGCRGQGALVTVCASVLIAYLVVSEFVRFQEVRQVSNMYVDKTIGEKLTIHFDVTFPDFPCAYPAPDPRLYFRRSIAHCSNPLRL